MTAVLHRFNIALYGCQGIVESRVHQRRFLRVSRAMNFWRPFFVWRRAGRWIDPCSGRQFGWSRNAVDETLGGCRERQIQSVRSGRDDPIGKAVMKRRRRDHNPRAASVAIGTQFKNWSGRTGNSFTPKLEHFQNQCSVAGASCPSAAAGSHSHNSAYQFSKYSRIWPTRQT